MIKINSRKQFYITNTNNIRNRYIPILKYNDIKTRSIITTTTYSTAICAGFIPAATFFGVFFTIFVYTLSLSVVPETTGGANLNITDGQEEILNLLIGYLDEVNLIRRANAHNFAVIMGNLNDMERALTLIRDRFLENMANINNMVDLYNNLQTQLRVITNTFNH
jgi:hypothetical protein